jgi:hypothetical protein
VFLGDYVGYGADPGWAIDTVEAYVERGAVAVLGNHDAASGVRQRMSTSAEIALAWTRPPLDWSQREFLARLPLRIEEDERRYVHAGPRPNAAIFSGPRKPGEASRPPRAV